MAAIEMRTVISGIRSIALAIIASVLSILSDKRAAKSYDKTTEAFQGIDRRSAFIDKTFGKNLRPKLDITLNQMKVKKGSR